MTWPEKAAETQTTLHTDKCVLAMSLDSQTKRGKVVDVYNPNTRGRQQQGQKFQIILSFTVNMSPASTKENRQTRT